MRHGCSWYECSYLAAERAANSLGIELIGIKNGLLGLIDDENSHMGPKVY